MALHKANKIALTISKWLSTCTIKLIPCENFLNRLSDSGKDEITACSIEQFYNFPSKQDNREIIKGLKGEIVALKMTITVW